MDKGCVVEQGTHSELIDKKGTYHSLVETQKLEDSKKQENDTTEIVEGCEALSANIKTSRILMRKEWSTQSFSLLGTLHSTAIEDRNISTSRTAFLKVC